MGGDPRHDVAPAPQDSRGCPGLPAWAPGLDGVRAAARCWLEATVFMQQGRVGPHPPTRVSHAHIHCLSHACTLSPLQCHTYSCCWATVSREASPCSPGGTPTQMGRALESNREGILNQVKQVPARKGFINTRVDANVSCRSEEKEGETTEFLLRMEPSPAKARVTRCPVST